ncbi:Ig-like domain-containing protein, partial [Citrobacter werkmanii]|uniref:Ig-like domain-containing protein n=1 Tax=Citrobacter werkmanii TaxID=67827 RepID=UPI0039C4254F
MVTDAHGNPVSGVAVNFTANNGASLSAASGVTGTDGSVSVDVSSTRAGGSTVTASLAGGSTVTTTVTFT